MVSPVPPIDFDVELPPEARATGQVNPPLRDNYVNKENRNQGPKRKTATVLIATVTILALLAVVIVAGMIVSR